MSGTRRILTVTGVVGFLIFIGLLVFAGMWIFAAR